MNARALIAQLASDGVTLQNEAGRLKVNAPAALDAQVLAEVKARKAEILRELSAASTCATDVTAPEPANDAHQWQNAESLRLANEIGGIVQTLAGAKRLKNGDWRINGERYDHDNALLLAAHARGTTTNGYPLEFIVAAE
jgi:hypothetical protein